MKTFILSLVLLIGMGSTVFAQNYNQKSHPEKRPGEMFVTNVSDSIYIDKKSQDTIVDTQNAARINMQRLSSPQPLRLGKHAYTSTGKPLPGYRPVFMQLYLVAIEDSTSR